MHSELNLGYLLHDRQRERDEHVEQGRRLSALRNNHGSRGRSLFGRWQERGGLLSLRWHLAILRQVSETTAEAA